MNILLYSDEGLEEREGGGGVLIPHSRSFFMRILHPTQFLITIPTNLVFVSQEIHLKV